MYVKSDHLFSDSLTHFYFFFAFEITFTQEEKFRPYRLNFTSKISLIQFESSGLMQFQLALRNRSVSLLVVTKAGSDCCKLPVKTTEEDQEGEVTASLCC